MQNKEEHFRVACENSAFNSLCLSTQNFLKQKSLQLGLSCSQIKNLITIAVDLQMWEEDIEKLFRKGDDKKAILKEIEEAYDNLKSGAKKYTLQKSRKRDRRYKVEEVEKKSFGFGSCPVASPKTRCCNLLTLDVFEGCAYECTYCSIQSFYDEKKIKIDKDFGKKLLSLELDKGKIYHIGTGQSSDSLLFGDSFGAINALLDFARANPNVILEFKSKSNNITPLLSSKVPSNVICTFSLNPEVVVQNEEFFSASLDERINSAKALRDRGILVGFHFHPMIVFENYQEEYKKIVKRIVDEFSADEVVMISFGTLTFIKPVLKMIRANIDKSKILQMPLVQTAGKYSYPLNQKKEMFKMMYDEFKSWHNRVFFYLCMEDESLWSEVFGYEYKDNDEFEEDMKKAYMRKIKQASIR